QRACSTYSVSLHDALPIYAAAQAGLWNGDDVRGDRHGGGGNFRARILDSNRELAMTSGNRAGFTESGLAFYWPLSDSRTAATRSSGCTISSRTCSKV